MSTVEASNGQKAALLATAADDGSVAGPAYTTPQEMRARSADEQRRTPFPSGRNSVADYPWTGIPGALSGADVRDLVQYRAACDWFRHVLAQGELDEETRAVISQIPNWQTFRGSPFEAEIVRPAIQSALAGDTKALQAVVDRGCVDLRANT
jgi:hypothetical protein